MPPNLCSLACNSELKLNNFLGKKMRDVSFVENLFACMLSFLMIVF